MNLTAHTHTSRHNPKIFTTGVRDWYALLREVLVNMHGSNKGGGGGQGRPLLLTPGHVSVREQHRAPISPKQIVACVGLFVWVGGCWCVGGWGRGVSVCFFDWLDWVVDPSFSN